MTDRRGSRARWTVLALLAPGGAAVFSAAMAWATSTVPSPPPPSSSPQRAVAVQTDDRAFTAAVRTACERRQDAERLRDRLLALRHDVLAQRAANDRTAAAVRRLGAARAAVAAAGPATYAVPAAPGPVAYAPQVVVVTRAAPAPPAHTTTGASGARP